MDRALAALYRRPQELAAAFGENMGLLKICSIAVIAVSAPAWAQEPVAGAGAKPAMGRDVADFPDITLVHPPYSLPGGGPDYDLPAGWDWSPTANSKFVGDFDGDGKTDVVARIVSQADRVSGLAIYLAMHRDAKGRYSHPIVIRDDVIVKLAGR